MTRVKQILERQQQLITKLRSIERGGDIERSRCDIEDAIREYFEVTAPKVAVALEVAVKKVSW